ncbi:MAG: host-nuclease inhibitor Gam family protein [Clostridiales bacterium]|nr:host-nuclease inhibitor Gam family protein [Clostridiales bacterium]
MSELIENYDDNEEVIEAAHYKIEDDMTAEWALNQIRMANAEKAKWKAFYDERYKRVCETCDFTIANMESLLQTYFVSVPHKVTDTQENYTLPSGKLVFKKQEPEYQRTDTDVIAWLKKNGGEKYIKTKEELDWSSLKKHITVVGEAVADEDGQIMPIKAVERPDIFKVELKKEKNNA